MSGHNPHITTMIDMAANQCMVVLMYRKGATRATIRPRMVEPYSFVEGKQDLMIRCYQTEHEDDPEPTGWRFFMSHKIDDARPTTIRFKPRRAITLPTGVVAEAARPNDHWNSEGRKRYRDYVGDALADGSIDAGERFDIVGIKREFGLTEDDIRFVHASIYQRCLGSVIDDGFVSDEEVEQIRFLHKAMKSLGWCVGD